MFSDFSSKRKKLFLSIGAPYTALLWKLQCGHEYQHLWTFYILYFPWMFLCTTNICSLVMDISKFSILLSFLCKLICRHEASLRIFVVTINAQSRHFTILLFYHFTILLTSKTWKLWHQYFSLSAKNVLYDGGWSMDAIEFLRFWYSGK